MDIHVSARQLVSAAYLWGLTAMASAAEPAWMVTPYLGYSTQMNFENTDSSTLHSKASNNTNPTNHCVNVAQLRWHNDFTPSTSDIKRCQASLQASRISSYPLKVRFANACCRNQLQTCSTGFNSGE